MRKTNPWAALGALCIGLFVILLDTTIVNVAVPAMISGLHASLNQVIWVNSVYLLTYAVPLLLTGRLGDRWGRKPMFLAGLAVFTVCSGWCAVSGSADMLIAARAVQGLGAAMMNPQTMAFIATLFPPEKRGAAMGFWGGVAGLATVAGPLLGGLLVGSLGWQWIFVVNVPIGVLGLLLTIFLVPGAQEKIGHKFDLLGTLLSGLGLFALVFGLQNGQQYDWGTVAGPLTIPEFIGAGVVLLVAFVFWQSRNPNEPLVPLGLFKFRNFTLSNVAIVMVGFALTGMFLPLIIYLQSVLGLSPLMSGVVTAPMSVLSGLVSPFAGRLINRLGGKYIALTGCAAMAAGVLLMIAPMAWHSDPWVLLPGLLVAGFGIGCVFPPMANLVTSDVPPQRIGAASGIFNTARQFGGVLGSAAIGVLLQARLAASLHAAGPHPGGGGTVFQHGFTDAARETMLLPAVVFAIGALACVPMLRVVRSRPRRPEPEVISEPV